MSVQLDKVVQWYPGHMAAAMRKIGEYIKLVDVVIEVADARVPRSGRNPLLDALIGKRTRILALAREDLADPSVTKAWIGAFRQCNLEAIAVDARSHGSVAAIGKAVVASAKSLTTARALIVGLPNSGKSTLINGLLRRAAARTENRAGITRQLQWFRLSPGVELMDSPGILVPKIATPQAQWMLAICGTLPHERYDPEHVVEQWYQWQLQHRPHSATPSLADFASARGFVRRGGGRDYHNAARSYIREFNQGSFGRLSLEAPQ